MGAPWKCLKCDARWYSGGPPSGQCLDCGSDDIAIDTDKPGDECPCSECKHVLGPILTICGCPQSEFYRETVHPQGSCAWWLEAITDPPPAPTSTA